MKILATTFLLLSIMTGTPVLLLSQESTAISPYVTFQYFKDNNDNRQLKTTLTYSRNRMEIPLPGMKISFYAGNEVKSQLAEIITDEKGVAIYNLKSAPDLSSDENGLWTFGTRFDGNDTIEPGSAELIIRDVVLKMELAEIDSIKTIVLHVEKLENGKMVPVSGELLTVSVPRMFSLLPIGEATLDDSGNASIEFPSDLPGDKDGNVTVIARFEEHPEFGNIEKRNTLAWGVPSTPSLHSSHRALWTKTAPKWMTYTLSILLTGVWGHYLFALISLIRIRRDAKRNKEAENYGK